MTFPESDRVVFRKNPLEEVVCQLRFPTILEIGIRPAEFQNEVRGAYPLYKKEDQPKLPIEIPEALGHHTSILHKFMAEEENRFISLCTDFVAYTDRNYRIWESFLSEFNLAKQALEDIHKPAFYSRIGLRYKDVIDRKELGLDDEPWEELLGSSLLGLLGAPNDVGSNVDEIFTQSSIKLDEVQDARATIRHGIGLNTAADNREVYIIDIDIYTTKRSKSQDVDEILGKFNQLSGNFFRWAITPRLREALAPEPVESIL